MIRGESKIVGETKIRRFVTKSADFLKFTQKWFRKDINFVQKIYKSRYDS